MRRTTVLGRTALLTVVGLLAVTAPAAGASKSIQATSDLRWSPSTVSALPGDSVTWTSDEGGFHNVNSTSGMFRSGAAPFSSFKRTFSAGTFGFECEIHPSTMRGSVRVKPRLGAAPDGLPFTVRWATSTTNTGSTFRVLYRVNSGDWRVWRSATTSKAAVFGQSGKPVTVRSNADYRFRVRSYRGDNFSALSPTAMFSP